MTAKPGGNLEAIKAAAKAGADALHHAGEENPNAKPIAAEAADKVAAILAKGKTGFGDIKSKLTKENGVMAGGAVLAADGVRRAVTKDADGKRHVARGAIQAAVGVGAFSAALISKRNAQTPDSGRDR
jgi:hypothetical protein